MNTEDNGPAQKKEFEEARDFMVEHDLKRRGLRDARILSAMRRVPRHRFVLPRLRALAYADRPLPIGDDQTISQPYIVALMTEALDLAGTERVLEIGTGSGYQAAILAETGVEVWTIERSESLHRTAAATLNALGYDKVHCLLGDGTLGHPAAAPFDRIVATGSLPALPTALLRQLVDGGVFIGPIGSFHTQSLLRVVYHPTGTERTDLGGCRFVPLIGAEGWRPRDDQAGQQGERRTR